MILVSRGPAITKKGAQREGGRSGMQEGGYARDGGIGMEDGGVINEPSVDGVL